MSSTSHGVFTPWRLLTPSTYKGAGESSDGCPRIYLGEDANFHWEGEGLNVRVATRCSGNTIRVIPVLIFASARTRSGHYRHQMSS
jgi:hypothetical protein